jgi:hypothetical protein
MVRIHIAVLCSATTTFNQKTYAIVAVATVAVMLIATSAISVQDAFAGRKKKTEYNQATSSANACGNGIMVVFSSMMRSQVVPYQQSDET